MGMGSHIMQVVVIQDTVIYPFTGSMVIIKMSECLLGSFSLCRVWGEVEFLSFGRSFFRPVFCKASG